MTRMTFHTYDTPCGGPYCTDTWIMNTGKLGYGRTYVSFINKLIHILILFFFLFCSRRSQWIQAGMLVSYTDCLRLLTRG